MKKILVAFGTRPEIIKLAPVIHELKKSPLFEVVTLHTGQHDELAQTMLNIFNIVPDYDFKSMSSTSDLFDLSQFLLPKLKQLLLAENPDALIVQGDTTSAYLSALSAFYLNIPVYHVEAGLRSFDNTNPFPEEMNRKQISAIASLHFAPTSVAKQNLLNEGIDSSTVFETGNTVIDALLQIKESEPFSSLKPLILNKITDEQTLIVVTVHRRENLGKPLHRILEALIKILNNDESRIILFPAHPNPKLQKVLHSDKYNHNRLKIIDPLDYLSFHHVLERSDLILTDSGGLQEEAAALCKRMLVLRNTTERQELIENGFTKLVGSNEEKIISETELALKSDIQKTVSNPYGDGKSAKKIVEAILTLIE